MDEFWNSGMEGLENVLRTNSATKAAFKLLGSVFEEISEFIREHNKGMGSGLCESFLLLMFRLH